MTSTDFSYNKIGILGGSFDPVHFGHLAAAEAVRCAFGLDKIIFIPSSSPPHKFNMTSEKDRLEMTKLGVLGNENFLASDLEIREKFSYTIETIRFIKANSNAEIYFIIGSDQLLQAPGWKDSSELMELCRFICVTRPGYDIPSDEKIKAQYTKGLDFLEIPALDISSSEIRKNVYYGKPVRYLIPYLIIEYIEKENLYKNNFSKYTHMLFEEIDHILKESLSQKRYLHTKGVAHEALKMSRRFNADEEKAYVAGLLHDCAKGLSNEEMKTACKKYGVEMDEYMKKKPDLCHSFIGAKMAEQVFGISDSEILNAIKWHTTGHRDMTKLEKIIYISDLTEATRPNHDGLSEIRELSEKDLDEAFKKALIHKIDYTKSRGNKVHPYSLEALNK